MNAQFAADAAIFTNVNDFGELITYTARGNGPKSISANVFTQQPEKVGATKRLLATNINVYIKRSDVPTVTKDADEIVFLWDSKVYTVSAIIDDNDPGLWHLVVN